MDHNLWYEHYHGSNLPPTITILDSDEEIVTLAYNNQFFTKPQKKRKASNASTVKLMLFQLKFVNTKLNEQLRLIQEKYFKLIENEFSQNLTMKTAKKMYSVFYCFFNSFIHDFKCVFSGSVICGKWG